MTVTNQQLQNPELARNRQKPGQLNLRIRLDGIKTAEGPVVTGLTEGANEAVRVWAPHQMTGVEVPPDRPGLAVIKRVSTPEAEPGDKVSYVIFYRNMGNTPIRNVSIADSLLPRLEYVKGTSRSGRDRVQYGDESGRLDRAPLAAPRGAGPGRRGARVVRRDREVTPSTQGRHFLATAHDAVRGREVDRQAKALAAT